MRDDLIVGGIYLSNFESHPNNVLRITKIEDVSSRFGKPNRIVHYERYAYTNGEWKWYENTCSWEISLGYNIFGDTVPEKYISELL